MAATEPIRDKKQLKELADYFLRKGQLRNYILVVMGTYTVLRISDLLRLKWSDVYDEKRQEFRTHITIIEKKTKKERTIALNPQLLGTLRQYYAHRRGEYVGMADYPRSSSGAWIHRKDCLPFFKEDLGISYRER